MEYLPEGARSLRRPPVCLGAEAHQSRQRRFAEVGQGHEVPRADSRLRRDYHQGDRRRRRAPRQAAAEEAQTEFTVVLTVPGSQKIQVIKELRTITALGLKESKELVDNAPTAVKEGVSKEEAEDVKGKLEAAGAEVEVA